MGWVGLLPSHRDAEALAGIDVVVVVVVTEVDLNPLDLAGEPAGGSGVVGRHGGVLVVADVGGLVGGEDHRLRHLNAPGTDSVAVVVEGEVAALGNSRPVVGEFYA